MTTYGDCYYCGGCVEEKHMRIDYRYQGQLFIIENARVGVCNQCGEQFFTAEVSEQLEEMARNQTNLVGTVAVPVLQAS